MIIFDLLNNHTCNTRAHATKHGGNVVAELVVPGESRSIILFEDACANNL